MKIFIRIFLLILVLISLHSCNIKAQDFKWVKGISCSVGNITSNSISTDSNGNSYVTGWFFGTATFDTIHITSYGGADIFIAKYDPDGNCLWAKHAGSTSYNNQEDYGMGISVDAKGNSYVTGLFYGIAKFDTIQLTAYGTLGNCDIFIAKYDSKGNVIWAKQAGGVGGDAGTYISLDGNGNNYITGFFENTATFGAFQLTSYGYGDIFIARYDPDGNCLWVNHAGGADDDDSYGITLDANGNSFITGYFYSGTVIFDTIQLKNHTTFSNTPQMFIAKYDIYGNCLWAKQPLGDGLEQGYGISHDANGNCYITGAFSSSITFDTINFSSYGDLDIFLAKYDSKGNVIWAKQAGGDLTDLGGNISVDAKGDCYITGHFCDTATFGSFHLTSLGGYDIFIAKYDHNGNCLWVQQAGGEYTDDGHGISVDAYGNSYITGIYYSTATFGTYQLSTNKFGAFIAKIPSSTVAIKNEINATPKEYSLKQNYPNPFNPNTIISYLLPSASYVKLIVYNSLGQTVKILQDGLKNAGNYSHNFNASDLPSGIYFYKLEAGQFSQIKKMMLIK